MVAHASARAFAACASPAGAASERLVARGEPVDGVRRVLEQVGALLPGEPVRAGARLQIGAGGTGGPGRGSVHRRASIGGAAGARVSELCFLRTRAEGLRA